MINNTEYKKQILLTDKTAFFKSYTEQIHDLGDTDIQDIKNKSMKGDEKIKKYCFC